MEEFAKRLALAYDCQRTRHSYYRNLHLIQKFFNCDPATISEDQFRTYILHVKTDKHWEPKTIRQTVATAKMFFVAPR